MKKVYAFIVNHANKQVVIGKKEDVIPLSMPGVQIQYADTILSLRDAVVSNDLDGMRVVLKSPSKALTKAFADLIASAEDPASSLALEVAKEPAAVPIIKKFFMQPAGRGFFAVHVVTDSGVKIIDEGPLASIKDKWMSYVKDRSLLVERVQALVV